MKKEIEKTKASCLAYYDKAYSEYFERFADELEQKPYDKDFLIRFAELIEPGGKVLDVGCCSTAQQARFFRDNGFRITSIDISKKCIETARENFPGIDFLHMDMLDMNFEHANFDAINAFYSIIHIPDEKLDGLFNNFNKVLKTGGVINITVHAGDFYGYYDVEGMPVFFRTFTQNDLEGLLKNHGFKIIEVKQRDPIYDFEFQSERIYLIAEKITQN